MPPEIQWLIPPKPERYVRVAYVDCPDFIQAAYGPNRDLWRLLHDMRFVWRDRYLFTIRAGSISDLASGMHFVPRRLASRSQHNNWLDDGAHVHDQGHLGTGEFPGVRHGRRQNRLFDQVMLALWHDAYRDREDVGRLRRWWQSGKPARKYIGVRLAAPFLWSPDYTNLRSDWITISDLHTETKELSCTA